MTRAPHAWEARISKIAALLRGQHQGRRHEVSKALAGALLSLQTPAEIVPAIVGSIAAGAGWDAAHHENNAIGTVSKWAAHDRVTGLPVLARLAPEVAIAVETIGAATQEEKVRAQNDQPAPATMPPAVAVDQIRSEIRNAYGLVVLRAQCGLGKSKAARDVAAERASKPAKSGATRAPLNSKTAISVPTHDLAKQHTDYLREAGIPTKRVFGVLSIVDADGNPVCAYAKQAKHFANGQSLPRLFCEGNGRAPCEFRETCPAYGGAEGPDDARITIGTHGRISELDAACGTTGLLVIDEPPDLLETQELTLADLDATIESLGYFTTRYAHAMAPALYAVRGWFEHETALSARENNFAAAFSAAPPPDVAVRALAEVGTDDPREAARLAFAPDHDSRLGTNPPIDARHIISLRSTPSVARAVGRASKVLHALWNAARDDRTFSTRIEEHADRRTKSGVRRVLLITGMRHELADALLASSRAEDSHPTVVLDANADLHVPIYQRIVCQRELGAVPADIDSLALRFRYREFFAPDGAHVQRTLLLHGASRKHWFENGQLTAESQAVAAVERAVNWILEDPTTIKVCLVTYVGLEVAIQAALGGHGALADRWAALGQDPDALAPLAARLAPVLARLPAPPETAHYGATRGLDRWLDADALCTLGDPVPNLGALRHDAAFLGLPDPDSRSEAVARAELEQAHGRLRTVHRTRAARSAHVGRVLPGGWHGAEIRGRSRADDWKRGGQMGAEHGHLGAKFGHLGAEAGTAMRNSGDMTAEEVAARVAALGGIRSAARSLGISPASVSLYANGKRLVSHDVAYKLRSLTAESVYAPPLPDGKISLDQGGAACKQQKKGTNDE